MSQEKEKLKGLPVSFAAVDNSEGREKFVVLLRLRNNDQLTILWLLVGLSICALVWLWFYDSGNNNISGVIDNPYKELHYLVDLNNAPKSELLQLPGIGDTLVDRIVEYRDDVAPFKDADEIEKIKGIGIKKCEAAKPYVYTR